MFQRRYLLPLLILPLALTGLHAAEPGHTSLFAGGDLTGWRYGKELLHRQIDTSDKRFSAATGVLVLAAKDRDGKKTPKELVSVREFAKDFVLKVEFKAGRRKPLAASSFATIPSRPPTSSDAASNTTLEELQEGRLE